MNPSIIIFEETTDSTSTRFRRRRAGRLNITDPGVRADVVHAMNNGLNLTAVEVVTVQSMTGKSIDIDVHDLKDFATQVRMAADKYGR